MASQRDTTRCTISRIQKQTSNSKRTVGARRKRHDSSNDNLNHVRETAQYKQQIADYKKTITALKIKLSKIQKKCDKLQTKVKNCTCHKLQTKFKTAVNIIQSYIS